MTEKTLGIIGGSGLYDLPGLEEMGLVNRRNTIPPGTALEHLIDVGIDIFGTESESFEQDIRFVATRVARSCV